ncbi:prominin-like protein isoform X2 [Drosophila novamexicana]|uniref:prominin-like protein isoform X2 n=1 Tax=Drosophila novamexicana TaxID=47314 RepID=UPI0011E5D47C|nr:prominin-like protein isoform X2 [Drosophila novamexicana]
MAKQSAKLRSKGYPSQAWILRVIIIGFLLLTLTGWIMADDADDENYAGYTAADRPNDYVQEDDADEAERAADDGDAGGGGAAGGDAAGGGAAGGGGGGGGAAPAAGGGDAAAGAGDAAAGGGDAAAGGGDAAAGGGDAAAGNGAATPGDSDFAINKEDVGTDWRYGFSGMGTTHEQMGQTHWPPVDYTEFESKVQYRKPELYSKMGLDPVFNFTHYLFNRTMTDQPALPDGYLVMKSTDTLLLGPKAEMNDWRDLLWMYWTHLLFVSFLMFLIIIVPFLAVCYCCFCCCRRCPRGCPPCTGARDARCRLLCGFLLLLLILLLLLGSIIALLANILIDKGFGEATELMKRSSDDTCRFLNDISAHINHLLGNNFEETVNHLTDMVNTAPNHIFLDLGDTSEANAVEEMERIFDNMPKALRLMMDVNGIEKELRFLTCQLRDGVRGVKREATQACLLSNNLRCNNFLRFSSIEYIDSTTCLHIDQLPDSTLYMEGMKQLINAKLSMVAKNSLLRLQDVKNAISKQLEKVGPPLITSLNKGRDVFMFEANKIRNLIERIVSDIHFNTLRSSKSFEGLYEKFAVDRSRINLAICILLILIVILLIIALILGCFLSKSLASLLLFCVMILIFCVFSFFVLVGLFYFMLGMVAFHGACAPLSDSENIYRHVASAVDLSRFVPKDMDYLGGPQPVQVSNALKACQIHQTIFNVLSDSNAYDITDLTRISILDDPDDTVNEFEEDFSNVVLFTKQEKKLLIDHISGNLSSYHSTLYVQNLCRTLTPHTLTAVAAEIRDICKDLYSGFYGGHYYVRVALTNCALSLEAYNKEWVGKIHGLQDTIRQKLSKIDELILYNNNNFAESVNVLLSTILRSEAFIQSRGKKYISELTRNLTLYCSEQVDMYIDMVISKCSTEVGECKPLAYTYYRGVEMICYHLVDPINAFWVGLLMCCTLFIPLLFVIHRLMCLYKVYEPYPSPRHNTTGAGDMSGAAGMAVVGAGSTKPYSTPSCPICTGAPYVPPPIVTCGGGQQGSCPCPGGGENRSPGGMGGSCVVSLPENMPSESYVGSDAAIFQSNKRKND